MRDVFQQELAEVQERLVDIANHVVVSIENAVRAFGDSNVQLAEQVIATDPVIDDKAVSLDELAINIIARQSPVARDLRIVVSALRISASLERMGDLARHIALLARYRFPMNVVPESLQPTFAEMGAQDIEIAKMLRDLLETQDLSLADRLMAADEHVDQLHRDVFSHVLGTEWQGAAHTTVDATLASRYHERFADHAVGIAKKVQYLATGDWVGDEDAHADMTPEPVQPVASTEGRHPLESD
ncbi:phosphate signaling complex protein PhoU [Agrococcus carbonis]|uniref:Phosphate-specific transport system accessory protein PhoU n=1 Tax=Agrococcus carbonis TaxID=684552 RepID=A0A1H1R766_9MICO|nr:phosphate signaling complex protein PhoU [Agrococcus carbonis]SDS31561.1 phosphate uptake regulator, PhoU [Agrococcus carbonis]